MFSCVISEQKLEETREELQRVAEAESLLRGRCACLEEEKRQKKDQIKVTPNGIILNTNISNICPSFVLWLMYLYQAVEFQVGELQGELGECKIRVATLERMLAQKELKLQDLQEQHGALQAERDGLKGELQHLETQHCSAMKEAQEQAHKAVVSAEESYYANIFDPK